MLGKSKRTPSMTGAASALEIAAAGSLRSCWAADGTPPGTRCTLTLPLAGTGNAVTASGVRPAAPHAAPASLPAWHSLTLSRAPAGLAGWRLPAAARL